MAGKASIDKSFFDIRTSPDYIKAQKQIQDAKKRLVELTEQTIKEGAKKLFETYPELKSFSWAQWTPSWNDGEPCVFRIDEDRLVINGYDFNNEEYQWDALQYDDDDNEIEQEPPPRELQDVVYDFISMFDDATLEEIYGNNVEVTVTPENISVDDFSPPF